MRFLIAETETAFTLLVALYFAVRDTKHDDKGNPLNSAVYVLTSDPVRYSDLNAPSADTVKPVADTATVPASAPSGYEEFEAEEVEAEAPEQAEEPAAAPEERETMPAK